MFTRPAIFFLNNNNLSKLTELDAFWKRKGESIQNYVELKNK